MFDLNLQKFEDKVDEIINEASQEEAIEKRIQAIEHNWKTTALSLVPYKKNNEFRAYILRDTENIKVMVEDDITSLQQMAGSRYIASFAEHVRKWEKALNTIQEVIDNWNLVQRKWMYLEAIFIGAQDIRMQLPEAAKKLDLQEPQRIPSLL